MRAVDFQSAEPVMQPVVRQSTVLAGLLFVVCATSAGGQSRVSGVVRDTFGLAIAGAEASIEGTALRTTTDSVGGFLFVDAGTGSRRLIFRRLGFRPTAMDVELAGAGIDGLEVLMVHVAQALAPVTVQARRESVTPRLSGFYERKARGGAGSFIGRERIERTHSFSFTDLLREIPGVTIRPIGGIQKAVRFRGSPCPPLVFIDGFPATAAEFDLETLDPGMLEGVEVYRGSATVPAVFAGPRNLDRCGVVAIWSRPAPSRRAIGPAPPRGERVELAALLEASEIYTHQQVDTVARLVEGSLSPILPDSLIEAGRTARVLVEFVVDTVGRAIRETVSVISSSRAGLAAAVRAAVWEATFVPAVRQGRYVRQLVQVPLDLDLSPSRRP
jgi:hypothetical protein